jgi:hypothetical protein
MAGYKMNGWSGYQSSPVKQKDDKRKVETTEQTSVTEGDDKHYTYKTNMYNYEGDKITGVTEENTSKVKKDHQGYEYSTILEDTEKHKKGDKVYWSKPLRSE